MFFRKQLQLTGRARVIAIIAVTIVGTLLAVLIATSIFPIEISTRSTSAQDNINSEIGKIDLIGTFDDHYKAYRVRVEDGLGYFTCLVVTSKNESNTGPVSLSCQ
jgi:hypothetical protein